MQTDAKANARVTGGAVAVKLHIRWMIRRDMPDVLRIARAGLGWDEYTFLKCLRQRNCIGMVACEGDQPIGFMVYELDKGRLVLRNVGVDDARRRETIGAAMIGKLKGKLSSHRRTVIGSMVPESCVGGQLFFRAQGFRVVSVWPEEFGDEDGYWFVYGPVA